MSTVKVYINSREYTISCSDGEEEKINCLAEEFAKRIKELNVDFKRFSQSHAFLTLGLILIDEINTIKNQNSELLVEEFSEENKTILENIQEQITNINYLLDKIDKKQTT